MCEKKNLSNTPDRLRAFGGVLDASISRTALDSGALAEGAVSHSSKASRAGGHWLDEQWAGSQGLRVRAESLPCIYRLWGP